MAKKAIKEKVDQKAPRKYASAKVKISYYSRYKLYTAGAKARIKIEGMVGIKAGQVVPIEDPGGKPFLIISNQSGKQSAMHYYAVAEEEYYNICRIYDYQAKTSMWSLDERPRRSVLTTLHQAVAKRVMDDFLKEKLNVNE